MKERALTAINNRLRGLELVLDAVCPYLEPDQLSALVALCAIARQVAEDNPDAIEAVGCAVWRLSIAPTRNSREIENEVLKKNSGIQ
jgi:hypothetical protein